MAKRKGRKANSLINGGMVVVLAFFAMTVWAGSRDRIEPFLIFAGSTLFALVLFASWKIWPRWAKWRRFRAMALDKVDSMPGHEFEHYVACLLQHQGFRAQVTRGSGDFGVDIVAAKGSVSFAVQCKRHNGNVSRSAVSDAVAGKQHYRCQEAMVITNRYFTDGAVRLAQSTHCHLIDRDRLSDWVDDYRQRKFGW